MCVLKSDNENISVTATSPAIVFIVGCAIWMLSRIGAFCDLGKMAKTDDQVGEFCTITFRFDEFCDGKLVNDFY